MPKKSAKEAQGGVVASNRKARHEYEIVETFEAGMVLTGSEVKSLRSGQASLREAFAIVRDEEVFLINMHIPPYSQAGYSQHEPTRARKLLLHKEEIGRLIGKTAERGLTLVPMQVYFTHGLAKVQLGLARGRKLYDKRKNLRDRETEMEIEQAMRRRR